MLSLSLFCSSQTISLALFEEKKLIKLFKKKILNNKIEGIFKILKKCLDDIDIKNISNIYFSSGPGSFTALRSIKAISQALALSSNSNLMSTSSFALLLGSVTIKEKKVLVCFKSTNNSFFYQLFEKSGKIFRPKFELKFSEENQLISYFLEKKKDYKDLQLLSSECFVSMKENKLNPIIKKVDASHLIHSIFLGYGTKNLKITYHNTYYEKF